MSILTTSLPSFQGEGQNTFSLLDVVLLCGQNEKLRDRVWEKTPDELKVKWITENVYKVCFLNSIW